MLTTWRRYAPNRKHWKTEAASFLTWRRCHSKSRCWLGCRRRFPAGQTSTWWKAAGGTCSAGSGSEPAAEPECWIRTNPKLTQTDRAGALDHLFALWGGRVVPVVGQVASEDVEFAGNDPPCVSWLHFALWGQKHSEVSSGERWGGNGGVRPGAEATQRAVRKLHKNDTGSYISTPFGCFLFNGFYPEKAVAAFCHGVQQQRLHAGLQNQSLPVWVVDHILFQIHRRCDPCKENTVTAPWKSTFIP